MLRFLALFTSSLGLFCLGCQATSPATTSHPAAPVAALYETRWVLRQLGTPAVTVPESGQEAYLLLRRTGTAEGQGGCNSFQGKAFTDSTKSLAFSALRSTRMACPVLATEQAFMQALAATHAYRISGDTLRLYSSTEPNAASLSQLEAAYLH